jgi:tetratricopeptide (TPR) repeat protein
MLHLFSLGLYAQGSDEQLAAQYYDEEKFGFALPLYEELAEKDATNMLFYDRYLECLLREKQFDKAGKIVKKRKRRYADVYLYSVDEGYILYRQGNAKAAEKIWDDILQEIATARDYNGFIGLAEAFQHRENFDYAIRVYERGEEVFEGFTDFGSQLAMLYMLTGNRTKGIEKYVNMILRSGLPYEQSRQWLEMNITDSADFAILRVVLLKQIQKMPDNYLLADLLKWTYIRLKDWDAAFIQTRALDKRLKEQGLRVIELGEICMSNEAWEAATRCFQYVVELGNSGMWYDAAVAGLLETRFQSLPGNLGDTALQYGLERDLINYINAYGHNDRTWRPISRLATLYSSYLHMPEKSIDLLEYFVQQSGSRAKTLAAAKLQLADAYVADGDVWSSELLYAQVEKDFEEDPLGQEAKYRRARLSYFRGNFEWARLQLDVLKGATTQLISNNAIELALKISENLGIDSNFHALEIFARAELLVMQNRFTDAEKAMDSIVQLYPGHALSDDILYTRATIKEQQGKYAEAAELYETLAIAFSHDLLADNAWFQLGLLYENALKDKEKAQEAFRKIVIDFPGSLYQPEARKHYRKLRGDSI